MVLLPQAQFAMVCMYCTSALWGCWVIITGSRYNLEMEIIRLDFKTGIEALLREKPIKAIFLGTRIGDPNAVHILTKPSLQGFCEGVLKLIASSINCQQVWNVALELVFFIHCTCSFAAIKLWSLDWLHRLARRSLHQAQQAGPPSCVWILYWTGHTGN